ncbi:MAG: hypothetical protein J6A65_18395, partial [Pseudomonas sp.]|nr:hypothetical protein [Pseudomonas sp.]
VAKEYISGFELVAEYNLEPFFDEENPPESLYLGKDKIEVKDKWMYPGANGNRSRPSPRA